MDNLGKQIFFYCQPGATRAYPLCQLDLPLNPGEICYDGFVIFYVLAVCGKCRTKHYRLRDIEDPKRSSDVQQVIKSVML